MTDEIEAYLRRLDVKLDAMFALLRHEAKPDPVETKVLSLIRIWREAPKNRRPSIEALAERITEVLRSHVE